MSVCEIHLQECFGKVQEKKEDFILSWSADPDAKRVHDCINQLKNISGWPNQQRDRYAAASHALFAQLRRDGLAFTARVLQAQARAKASDGLPLVDQPKFVLLAHLIACLGPDLIKIGIIESTWLTGENKDSTAEGKVEEVIRCLLDIQSLDWVCFLNLRALALSEWFKRYAESLFKVTRQAAQDQGDNLTE